MADVTLALTGLESSLSSGSVSSAQRLSGLAVTSAKGSIEFNTAAFLTGRGFSSLITLVGYPVESGLIGQGFNTVPLLYQAAIGTGSGFATNPTLTLIPGNESFLTGRGFATSFVGKWVSGTNGNLTGRGFGTNYSLIGAAVGVGRSFVTSPLLEATAPIFGTLTGRGFNTTFDSTATASVIATLTGRGFETKLGFSGILTGRGFTTLATISATFGNDYAVAFVMNAKTAQVSRYTNYPFNNIIAVNEKYYGVKSDGLYLLEGETDLNTAIVGSITTKDDDFGVMQSKNVPFIYLGCDDKLIAVTPIVDGVTGPTFVESFDGRKVKMARGNKGRYWRFRIDKIKKLQSLETLQETLDRRVK